MNRSCIAPRHGRNPCAKRSRARGPASIGNNGCARCGALPEAPGWQTTHRVVAGLGRATRPARGPGLALHGPQARRRGDSYLHRIQEQ